MPDEPKASIRVERDGREVPVELGERRHTAEETVAVRVRAAIAAGALASGDEFAAGKLGRALKVSRVSATGGLRQLETEGLVAARQGAYWRVV